MANENPQKIKLLKIMDMLNTESDEQHPLRTSQLLAGLRSFGITCDRRTLATDIGLLNRFGYGISSRMVGHEKAYFIAQHSFSVPELKILIDAVQAARFIPEGRTADMTDRIAALGGCHKGEVLKGNMVCFSVHKHSNEEIFNSIAQAIRDCRKASFLYYDLNENGEKVYRRKGARHIVNPMALLCNSDNCYLIAYASKVDGIYTYRVDRMEQVFVLDEPVIEDAILDRSNLAEFNRTAVSMYGGPSEEVLLEFDGSVISAIHDRFGESVPMERIKSGSGTNDRSGLSNCYLVRAEVQISPAFWGWLFQFVGKVRIIAPSSAVKEYQIRLKDALRDIGAAIDGSSPASR